MAKKIFIQNLPKYITGEKLKELFSVAGNVNSATIVHDKKTGQANGTGFVDMVSDDDAKKVIAMFDGKNIDGSILKVSEAIMLDV